LCSYLLPYWSEKLVVKPCNTEHVEYASLDQTLVKPLWDPDLLAGGHGQLRLLGLYLVQDPNGGGVEFVLLMPGRVLRCHCGGKESFAVLNPLEAYIGLKNSEINFMIFAFKKLLLFS